MPIYWKCRACRQSGEVIKTHNVYLDGAEVVAAHKEASSECRNPPKSMCIGTDPKIVELDFAFALPIAYAGLESCQHMGYQDTGYFRIDKDHYLLAECRTKTGIARDDMCVILKRSDQEGERYLAVNSHHLRPDEEFAAVTDEFCGAHSHCSALVNGERRMFFNGQERQIEKGKKIKLWRFDGLELRLAPWDEDEFAMHLDYANKTITLCGKMDGSDHVSDTLHKQCRNAAKNPREWIVVADDLDTTPEGVTFWMAACKEYLTAMKLVYRNSQFAAVLNFDDRYPHGQSTFLLGQ